MFESRVGAGPEGQTPGQSVCAAGELGLHTSLVLDEQSRSLESIFHAVRITHSSKGLELSGFKKEDLCVIMVELLGHKAVEELTGCDL